MQRIKKYLLILLGVLAGKSSFLQPYVDPLQVRFTNGFRNNNSTERGTPFTHLWAGSDIPVKLAPETYLLLSPYYENWQLDSGKRENIVPGVHSLSLPVGLLLPLKNKKWSLSLTAILRSNAEKLLADKTIQAGGAGFLSYEKAKGKKLRFGLYINSDFFGLFVMPLAGADWRINKRNYLFGLLPGRFTWEHQFNNRLFGGLTFRAITNSYRLRNGNYLRIDDNQLSGFLDIYLSRRICLTVEPGYGIMRKLRTGVEKREYFPGKNWEDGFFIKLSTAYRIRFEK